MSKLTSLPSELGILGWEDLAPTFFAAFVAGIPSVFIGDPGAAKTTFLERYAQALGLRTAVLDAQFITQTKLLGMPNPDALRSGRLEYVGGIPAQDPELVIIDELTRMNDATQGLLLEFLRTGRLDRYYIKCKRVAACNPPTANLVGVHYLDYAQATRIVHIEVPTLKADLAKTFVDRWNLGYSISSETQETCQQVYNLTLTAPPKAKLSEIALPLIAYLQSFNINGRQIDSILRLLSASYTIEQSGLHSYSAEDIGSLIASVVPIQLTKHSWPVKEARLLAKNLTKHLADYPWKQVNQAQGSTQSMKVEEMEAQFKLSSLTELAQAAKESTLRGFVAFKVLLGKIAADPQFDIAFDNFEKLLELR